MVSFKLKIYNKEWDKWKIEKKEKKKENRSISICDIISIQR